PTADEISAALAAELGTGPITTDSVRRIVDNAPPQADVSQSVSDAVTANHSPTRLAEHGLTVDDMKRVVESIVRKGGPGISAGAISTYVARALGTESWTRGKLDEIRQNQDRKSTRLNSSHVKIS